MSRKMLQWLLLKRRRSFLILQQTKEKETVNK
jgi:hypothetical protein